MGIQDEIKEIEDEIRKTSYNKATQVHIGRLKAKLARLREEAVKPSGTRRSGPRFGLKKSGDATVVMVGSPSVGKSTLLTALTNAESEVGAYDFTTVDVIPGAMEIKGAKIQLFDVPGLIQDAAVGRGRGREIISVVRNADILLIILDIQDMGKIDIIRKELYDAGIRINLSPPDITIKKRESGGINISTVRELSISNDEIVSVASEYKIYNADILIRGDVTIEDFIDSIQGNRKYVPALILVNKIDLVKNPDSAIKDALGTDETVLQISALGRENTDRLRDEIFRMLDFKRVYMKPQGRPADMENALIIKSGATVGDVCGKIHRSFRRNFKYARVWGDSVRYGGQRVGLDHKLADGDIVTLILRK